MRNGFISFLVVMLLLSCNDNGNTPSAETGSQPTNGDSSNAHLQNKEVRKRPDSVTTDLASLEQAFNENPSQDNAFELAYGYAEAKDKKALWFTDTLLKYGGKQDIGFAWYAKGLYHQNIGDVQKALRFYDSSMITDYTFLDTYREKGQLQFSLKQYEAALKTFAQGQNLSHDLSAKAEFIYWVAKCFEVLGDKRNAKDNYDRAYAMDKTLVEAKEASDKISL